MKDPIPKNFHGSRGSTSVGNLFQSNKPQYQSSNQNQTGQAKKKKAAYCWYFNRGDPCKYGKKCRFTEKCSY